MDVVIILVVHLEIFRAARAAIKYLSYRRELFPRPIFALAWVSFKEDSTLGSFNLVARLCQKSWNTIFFTGGITRP